MIKNGAAFAAPKTRGIINEDIMTAPFMVEAAIVKMCSEQVKQA